MSLRDVKVSTKTEVSKNKNVIHFYHAAVRKSCSSSSSRIRKISKISQRGSSWQSGHWLPGPQSGFGSFH